MLSITELQNRSQIRNDFQFDLAVGKAAPYSTGDVIGGLMTIDNGSGLIGPIPENEMSAILQSLVILDPDSQNQAMDLFFFNKLPTSVFTDNGAFAPSVADLQNCIGVIHVPTTAYIAAGSLGAIAGLQNIGQVLKPANGSQSTALYCVAVSRGTPTFSNGNMWFRFQFSQGL